MNACKKIVFLIFVTYLSCQNEVQSNSESIIFEESKWKLVGIVDSKSGSIKELEPKDCMNCYYLTFETDSQISGRAAGNLIIGFFEVNYEKQSLYFKKIEIVTEIMEYGDEKFFINILKSVKSFFFKNEELRLYYNDQKNYLKFKMNES